MFLRNHIRALLTTLHEKREQHRQTRRERSALRDIHSTHEDQHTFLTPPELKARPTFVTLVQLAARKQAEVCQSYETVQYVDEHGIVWFRVPGAAVVEPPSPAESDASNNSNSSTTLNGNSSMSSDSSFRVVAGMVLKGLEEE
jgi:hypothetical protein